MLVVIIVATHVWFCANQLFIGNFRSVNPYERACAKFVGMRRTATAQADVAITIDTSPAAPQAGKIDAYTALTEVPLVRASDGEKVDLPSLWGNGILGLGGDKVVVAFLRHFG